VVTKRCDNKEMEELFKGRAITWFRHHSGDLWWKRRAN